MRRNKYNNRKIVTEDGSFDSKAEWHRWLELNLMLKNGMITDLQRQVKFLLVPKQVGEQKVEYKADYVYMENGKMVVEDVKSEITKKESTYVLKRKLMLWVHKIKVVEVEG